MDNKISSIIIENNYDGFPKRLIDSNDIEKLGYKWYSRNELPKILNDGNYIINLDDSQNFGSHWCLITVSNNYVFYYDPYGTYLSGFSPQEVDRLAKNMNYKQHDSPFWTQHVRSNMCGYNVLFFANILDKYIGKLSPKIYDKIILKTFGDSPDSGDIKRIITWSKSVGLIN